jgi:hypothetical protein
MDKKYNSFQELQEALKLSHIEDLDLESVQRLRDEQERKEGGKESSTSAMW